MTQNQKRYAFAGAVLFQLLIVLGMLAHANHPLIFGKEVHVKTLPVDPRSLFRGNYARLNYDFTRIKIADVTGKKLKRGNTIFVKLKEENGVFAFEEAVVEKPDDGVFLRGTIKYGASDYVVDYGIDAYFAKPEEALRLERDMSTGGIAVLKVTQSGRAAIADIIPDRSK